MTARLRAPIPLIYPFTSSHSPDPKPGSSSITPTAPSAAFDPPQSAASAAVDSVAAAVAAAELGLSRDVLFDVLFNGPPVAPFIAVERERIEAGNFGQADFALRLLQKALHLAASSAYESGVAMPLTNLAKEIYRLAIREGHGDEDISAIYAYLARSEDGQPFPHL